MQENPEERKTAEEILKRIEEEYGFIPVVNQVLSTRPDMFIPMSNLSRAVLEGKGDLDQKTRYLCAVAAATATGGEHCVRVQSRHAIDAGASRDEILESMVIGSYMAMTRAQSYAFRGYAELFDIEIDKP